MRFSAVSPERLAQLLAAIANDDARALFELYDCCSPHLNGLLTRMLKNPDWAQEALQDVFIRVWQRAESYSPEKGEPMAWLIGIARYRALDLLHSKRAGPELSETDVEALLRVADHGQGPEDYAIQREGLERLSRCMEGLHDQQRKSLLLAYYEGYSHQELSRVMNAPLGTVKAWVRRGLALLRECLTRGGPS